MYHIRNPYKDCCILDLNLMEAQRFKKFSFSFLELALILLPILMIAAVFMIEAMPSFEIFAQCYNVRGGDVCHFSME